MIEDGRYKCFNPCFYGSYSFTIKYFWIWKFIDKVLILVFMEVILLLFWAAWDIADPIVF